MNRTFGALLAAGALLLSACASIPPSRPAGWNAPEVVVPPSSFTGVHGLAVDKRGRLLAGSVVGNAIWEVDRNTGAARVLVDGPEGQADDIAIGANGEMAWTNYLMGMLRYRENDAAPMRVLAKDLAGLNSLDFDRRNGKLYASQVFLGDALWEIDVAATKPPRLIAKDLGGLNGFEVGPDGMIYGPLWFKNSVVKVDPSSGAITVINNQFKTPAAANLDGKGNLWVVDTRDRRAEQGRARQRQEDRRREAEDVARQPRDRARGNDLRLEHGRQLGRGRRPRHRRGEGADARRRLGAVGRQGVGRHALGRRHLQPSQGRPGERRRQRRDAHARRRRGDGISVRRRRLGRPRRADLVVHRHGAGARPRHATRRS